MSNPDESSRTSHKDTEVIDNRIRLAKANGFAEVYEIVKDTVKKSLGRYRIG